MLSFAEKPHLDWAKEIPGAVTICDRNAIIVYMNDKARGIYQKSPEDKFIGKSLFDCHNERSRRVLEKMLQEETSNFYTTEKEGIKKFISQIPWKQNGEYLGIIEISLEIPLDMPHYVR